MQSTQSVSDHIPFFTIITATHHAGDTVSRLLTSLAAQTCRDFAWHVQDGASTDNTLEVIEAWRTRLPAVSVHSEPDGGIYDAWNRALDHAGAALGRWVLFLGADDALADSDVLARVRAALEQAPGDVCLAVGEARIRYPDGRLFETMRWDGASPVNALRREMPFCHTALLHRRELFDGRRFDATFRVLGDYDFVCRALRQDTQVTALPFVLTDMHLGGISSSLDMQPGIFRESVRIAWRHFRAVQGHHVRVGLKVGLVSLLLRTLGPTRAAQSLDAWRRARHKTPRWHLPAAHFAQARPLHAHECAVVLVNYNSTADTLDCLRALLDMPALPGHIVVVDNGSMPDALSALEAGMELVRQHLAATGAQRGGCALQLLRQGENTGFAAGNNAALRHLLQHSPCRAFWLLNNDTVPDARALAALCARLNQRPSAGLCGSTLLYAHAPEQVQAAGGSVLSALTGRTFFVRGNARHEDLHAEDEDAVAARMDFIVGASLLVRREVLETIGLLPELYFLYYEDAAFCLNARRAGFGLAWARDSVVLHKEGGSTAANGGGGGRGVMRSAGMDYLLVRNRIHCMRRYHPWTLPVALGSVTGVLFNRIRRNQPGRLPLLIRATIDGLCGRMGARPSP